MSSPRATPTWPGSSRGTGRRRCGTGRRASATLLHIVLEQQVSLASARAAFDRLLAAADPLTPARFLALDRRRAPGDRVQPPEGALRAGARRGDRGRRARPRTGSVALDDDAVHRRAPGDPGHRAVDLDDLPADGARPTRRLAGWRHRAGNGGRRGQGPRAAARAGGDGRRSGRRGGRGGRSRRGSSGTTTWRAAAGPADTRARHGSRAPSDVPSRACIGAAPRHVQPRPSCQAMSRRSSMRSRPRSARSPAAPSPRSRAPGRTRATDGSRRPSARS